MEFAEKRFQKLLTQAVAVGASDIHFKMGLPPIVRVAGRLRLLSSDLEALKPEDVLNFSKVVLPNSFQNQFNRGEELDLSYSLSGVGRFRLNLFKHRGQRAIICRFIPFKIQSIEELNLPSVLKKIPLLSRGLVLVTGSAGSGKSTTLAAMLNERNQKTGGHIVTIEDPIEYLIRDKKAIITQREVGIDTVSFSAGLKNILRQDPDVIMIGEMRDRETVQTALMAAETGHLVMSTLHTNNAAETIQRIIGIFEHKDQETIRMQFAAVFAAVISQRLVPTVDENDPAKDSKTTVIPATEILVNTGRVHDYLVNPNKMGQITQAMEQGSSFGMHTFDQDLMRLYSERKITKNTALKFCSNPNNFELRLRGIKASGDPFQRSAPKTGSYTLTDGQSIDLVDNPRKKKE